MSPNQIRMKEALAPMFQCVQQVLQCTALVTGRYWSNNNGNVLPADAVSRHRHDAWDNRRQVTAI